MSTAFLIIDIQLGNFIGSYPVHEGDKLLKRVRSLIDKARSARTLIIYVQNNGGDGNPDEYGTSGWEIHPLIKPEPVDLVIQKGSPDAFHETSLHRELRSRGIKRLVARAQLDKHFEIKVIKSSSRVMLNGFNSFFMI